MNELTNIEALQLLPAVVDNEATIEEKNAFLKYIERDTKLEKEYNDALFIKKLLSERYKKVKAPEYLKRKIQETLEQLEEPDSVEDQTHSNLTDLKTNHTILTTSKNSSSQRKTHFFTRYLSAAAVLLIITLTILELLDRAIPSISDPLDVIVENMTVQHFINSGGELIDPQFSTSSRNDAEQYLFDHFGITMTIPAINGADFRGIVMSEFVDNFETPLLEYSQDEMGETIYLFAFDMDQVSKHEYLIRHKDAAESCITQEDFFVAEIENYHVVSWLWNNVWYTAISNHNGYDLATLVEPLNYSP